MVMQISTDQKVGLESLRARHTSRALRRPGRADRGSKIASVPSGAAVNHSGRPPVYKAMAGGTLCLCGPTVSTLRRLPCEDKSRLW
jgi:hypothetical protein